MLGFVGASWWKFLERTGSLGNGVGETSGSESLAAPVRGIVEIGGYFGRVGFGRAAHDQRI